MRGLRSTVNTFFIGSIPINTFSFNYFYIHEEQYGNHQRARTFRGWDQN